MRKTETPAATELRDRARAAPARWTDAVAVGDWDRVERELYDLHWALRQGEWHAALCAAAGGGAVAWR